MSYIGVMLLHTLLSLLHVALSLDCVRVLFITVSAFHKGQPSAPSVLLTAGGAVMLLTNR